MEIAEAVGLYPGDEPDHDLHGKIVNSCNSIEPFVMLRHDVDIRPQMALEMAGWRRIRG